MTPLRFAPCLLALAACIRAPDVVMVDRATALEQQAAGSFDEVELKLIRTGVVPRPVPLTPEQLEALGVRPPTPVDDTEQTEADRIDDLLRNRCIGEGRDGLLVDTHASCLGASDRGDDSGERGDVGSRIGSRVQRRTRTTLPTARRPGRSRLMVVPCGLTEPGE